MLHVLSSFMVYWVEQSKTNQSGDFLRQWLFRKNQNTNRKNYSPSPLKSIIIKYSRKLFSVYIYHLSVNLFSNFYQHIMIYSIANDSFMLTSFNITTTASMPAFLHQSIWKHLTYSFPFAYYTRKLSFICQSPDLLLSFVCCSFAKFLYIPIWGRYSYICPSPDYLH